VYKCILYYSQFSDELTIEEKEKREKKGEGQREQERKKR
jgi:hypothetical protein